MSTAWRFTRRLKPSARLILSDRGSGLHLVGALSVHPLEENSERNILLDARPSPDHSSATRPPSQRRTSSISINNKKTGSKTPPDCPQSTAVSGTTPSGCTQRAPTGMVSTRNGPPNPSDGQTTRRTRSRREEIPSNQLLDAGPAPNHSKKYSIRRV